MTELDGPRIAPGRKRADALVVLVHGYGADGDDLIGLGHAWRDMLPGAAFVAPDAPERMPFAGFGGYQWFPLTTRSPEERLHGTEQAAPALANFIDAELRRLDLTHDRLAIVGFSQGTMLALHVGLRRTKVPAAIVGFSGVITGAETLAGARASLRLDTQPRILLMHGEDDEIIPAEALDVTREALAGAGLQCIAHLIPGLGHGIDAEGLQLAGLFLAETLRAPD